MNKPTKEQIEKLVGKHKFNSMKKAFGLSYKFEDVTLADGTMVKVEPSVEEGATVVVVDSEGVEVPAPDGDHELQDGRVITTEGGVIIQVLDAPVADEEMSADAPATEVTELLENLNKRLIEVESKFKSQTEVLAKVEAIEKKVNAIDVTKFAKVDTVNSLKSEVEDAKALVVKMANEPVAEPHRQPKRKANQHMYSDDPAIEAFTKTIKAQ